MVHHLNAHIAGRLREMGDLLERAHQLNKSTDRVLIFVTSNLESDWQCAVVTETRGVLRGKRVVRGREAECARVYAREPVAQRAA
jgi:hypothetical protein